MSGEVDTALDISGLRSPGFLDFARNDSRDDLAQRLFSSANIYHDVARHSAAMNMAIDEALLQSAVVPSIRFYRWHLPALSFGYFGRFLEVSIYAGERDLVRRWTGGGTVFHGEDLTYAIVIPASDPAFRESSMTIYEKIHRALADTFKEAGQHAVVAGEDDPAGIAGMQAVKAEGNNCFSNPVRADVMMDGRKIAGAAQRRTRRGLLQQGSIQAINLNNRFADRFAKTLSSSCNQLKIEEKISQQAREIARQKYGTDTWLRKR
ncbi:MAG: biotin/lipoate A/B protein ligase family protein [Alphaproteobacteria bacterium]